MDEQGVIDPDLLDAGVGHSEIGETEDHALALPLTDIFHGFTPGPTGLDGHHGDGVGRPEDGGADADTKLNLHMIDSMGHPDEAMPEPGSGQSKRVKGGEDKIKRTRQSQSCDPCRARKVKCDRPPPGTNLDSPTRDVCSHCKQLGLECTFEYKPKKRGPPNMYIKRMQAERAASHDTPGRSSANLPEQNQSPISSRRDTDTSHSPGNSLRPLGTVGPYSPLTASYAHPMPDPYIPPGGPGGTLSSQNTYGGSALGTAGNGPPGVYGRHINVQWDQALQRAVAATAPVALSPLAQSHAQGLDDGFGYTRAETDSSGYAGQQPSQISKVPGFASAPPTDQSHGPVGGQAAGSTSATRLSPSLPSPRWQPTLLQSHPSQVSNNPLDRILPRGLLLHIIDLFFDYIYPLIPVIHRPTFSRDVDDHREERKDEGEWTHMVLILVASTLVQVPRSFVPLPRREVKALAEKCWDLTRSFMARDYTSVSLERLTIQYFITAHMMNKPLVGYALFGANAGMLIRLRLHEEASYSLLPPLEKEFRRRLFWLAYGGDRSVSAIDGLTTLFTEDECDVDLPMEIDDEFITEDAYLEQPTDRVSLISGFNYISRIFRISGQVMTRRRRDRRAPPTGLMLQMRITEVNDLYEQIITLMDDCPEPLRLDWESDNRSVANFSDDWDTHASADIRTLFFDPKASRAVVKDAFLVQQANIYVTQQMVRYMTLQYRDELQHLRQTELNKASLQREIPGPGGGVRRQSNGATRREWTKALMSEEEKDQVAMDLLGILQKIPIQVIAVNSSPLVVKVRFVASTLLDALSTPAATPAHHASDHQSRHLSRTQRAQGYLWDFLRILSEIEALYTLNDEESVTGVIA